MPIMLAQPGPGGSFAQIAQQGNLPAYLNAYSSMANALQSRYASESASRGREALGFAQLDDERAARQGQMGLHAMEIQARGEQEQAAIMKRAEMENWQMNQQMTRNETQELAQRRNAMVELDGLKAKGLVNDDEYALKAASIRSRVDFLSMKEKLTSQKIMNDKHEQETALFKSHMDKEQEINRIRGQSVTDRMQFIPDDSQRDTVAGELRSLDPTLERLNPAEFELQLRDRMKRQGKGFLVGLQPDGKFEVIKHGPGAGGGGTGTHANSAENKPGGLTDQAWASAYRNAEGKVKGDAAKTGETLSDENRKSRIEKSLREQGLPGTIEEHNASRQTPAEKKRQDNNTLRDKGIKGKEATFAEIKGLNLSPGAIQAAGTLLGLQKRMLEKHGAYEHMPADLKAKMDDLAQKLEAIRASAGSESIIATSAPPGQ